jgi:acyl-CoA synthetase (AMP-forming)/AMP-acid ligase II
VGGCERIGLCEYVVEDGRSRERAEELAHQIARFPQTCVRADRRSAIRQHGLPVRDALVQEWYNGRITGRVKEMIIRGGENHFPMEIENVLLEHPAVAEVAVVGLPDKKWGEIIACFIRSEGNQALDVRALHGHCRQHLSPQKTTTVWCKVDNFPLTGPGNIQKFMLRDGYLAGDYKAL